MDLIAERRRRKNYEAKSFLQINFACASQFQSQSIKNFSVPHMEVHFLAIWAAKGSKGKMNEFEL